MDRILKNITYFLLVWPEMLGMPHLHMEELWVLPYVTDYGGMVTCSSSGTWLGLDVNAYLSQLGELLGFLNPLDLTRFSVWWYSTLPYTSEPVYLLKFPERLK